MRIRLVNIDSTIPNLALMQISAWHKSLGDEVGFDVEDPDKVYISCIFKKNAEQARGVSKLFPSSTVVLGGSGVDLKTEIPAPAQKIMPDYSLYSGMDYDLGFTTRGCIRDCQFCVVPEKEGKIRKFMPIEEFHDKKHSKVKLLDNNIYALPDWFFEQTDYAIENGLKLDITQGMDIRLLTEEIAEQLARIKWAGTIHFAFDSPAIVEHVKNGVQLLKNVGINCKQNVDFYVLTGFNTTPEQDIERCNLLRSLGTNAFVMQYRPTPTTRKLARWANRRWLYWSCEFEKYNCGRVL